VHRCVSVLAL